MRVFGIILAGGSGRRMGGADKAMLTLGGARLIDICAARLGPQVEEIAISANGDASRFASRFDGRFGGNFGGALPVLPDTQGAGPLAGIWAGMDWAAGHGADYLATVAVDTPHFPCDLVAQLRIALEQAGAALALARSGRVHGTFGLWPVALRADLAAFLASGAKPRVLDYATRCHAAYADFAAEGAFDNINTPQDLAQAQAQLEAM